MSKNVLISKLFKKLGENWNFQGKPVFEEIDFFYMVVTQKLNTVIT